MFCGAFPHIPTVTPPRGGASPPISQSHLVRKRHQEFVRVVTNVGSNLDNLKRLKSEQEQLLLNHKLEQIRYVLRDELKPFRSYPLVDSFLAQLRKSGAATGFWS